MTSARPIGRGALCLGLAALGSLGLAACGSGAGSSTSSTTTATNPSTTTVTAPSAKTPSAKPSPPHGSEEAPSAARQKAGAAKPFVEPHADNSIPTFGSESTDSDRSRAEAALRAYLTARAKGDWAGACSHLAASMGKQLQALAGAAKGKPNGCAAVYAALTGRAPASTRANPLTSGLLSLRIKGTQGFALWVGPHGQRYVMPMAREGSEWKVTQLAPIAYPLGSTPTAP